MATPFLSSSERKLEEALVHLHPLQRQHAIQLHREQTLGRRAHMQASLRTFTACTVPCRARSRFLNLRDSVKRSSTKSTAKVCTGQEIPWVPFTFMQVLLGTPQGLRGPSRYCPGSAGVWVYFTSDVHCEWHFSWSCWFCQFYASSANGGNLKGLCKKVIKVIFLEKT